MTTTNRKKYEAMDFRGLTFFNSTGGWGQIWSLRQFMEEQKRKLDEKKLLTFYCLKEASLHFLN